ncbi:MAG TPA: endopeptidase La [Thermomicrobiales bacterium]|nr:endopeptidase La [Thermomicrobiales bacterium]
MPSRKSADDQAQANEPNETMDHEDQLAAEAPAPKRSRARTVKDVTEELAAAITAEKARPREDSLDDEVPAKSKRTRSRRKKVSGDPDQLLLPVIITEETLLLPHMSIPFPLVDEDTTMAVERAMRMDPRHVMLLTERRIPRKLDDGELQVDAATRDLIDIMTDMIAQGDDEGARKLADEQGDFDIEAGLAGMPDDADYELCEWGVIAEVGQYITRPGGQNHVILNGLARGRVEDIIQDQPFVAAKVRRVHEVVHPSAETEAAMGAMLDQVESYIAMLPNVPEEVLEMVKSVDEPGWLADLIAFSPEFSSDQRQEMVETIDPLERLRKISVLVQKRLNVLNLRHEIQSEAQAGMDKQQREYFLREQLRAIQKELGEGSSEEALANEIREKIETAGMPDDVKQKALVQVERLEQQHPFSPEVGVIRTYLEWLTDLPWSHVTEDRLDLEEAANILDEDHYGLEKVKDRIVEFIAVRKLAGDRLRAPILCFVGPPGVGKTSLGKSIARAIGREYVRMSLGGVRDEAEIRGHRRTYVGAMPGRVIKALKDAGTKNPVLVLDEVDKLGSDTFRGDPSSALLEVLDPEQNTSFSDHYLEVPFDLSKVIFITTANMLDPIPPALRDRMEIIEVSGYTELEKLEIARNFLLPKSLESHGLTDEQLIVNDGALKQIIREYTEESGVRNLEREIGTLCRKIARTFAEANPPERVEVDGGDVHDYLGIPRYDFGLAEEQDEVGVATGAAVTSVGGDLLSIEVTIMEGKGDLILTGQLGDVMQESARAAMSYARTRAATFKIEPGFFDKHNIHVHIPAGAIPKDGPSAGITMATALISALTGRKVRKDVAMTGEMTLRGKVLPIGGLREKTLAAHRGGIKTFLLPKRNAKDLSELPEIVRKDLELIEVSHLDEVLEIALAKTPSKRRRKASSGTPKVSDEPSTDDTPQRRDRRSPRIDAPGGKDPVPASVGT